ncbi:MAG: DHH family phosphoesterase [Clostridia bacterium]|nr:DHH family phosphoesterase [Clostridia bacterium]
MDRKPHLAFVPLFAAGLLACVLLGLRGFEPMWLLTLLTAICIISFLSGLFSTFAYKRAVNASMNEIFRENDTTAGNVITNIAIPCLLFDGEGRIVWTNDAFAELYSGNDICRLIPNMDPRFPNQAQSIDYNGRSFQLISMPIQRIKSEKRLTFQYWLDRTEALHYSRLYEEQMPTIGLVQVDNYDDLMTHRQFHRNTVLAEVENKISDFVTAIDGVYRRYDNSKFFFVFEAKHITDLEQQRFSLLDSVREIDTGTGQSVTLSISIGVAEHISASDEAARNAMQLALGRGGDQAVIKRGSGYSFFGGKRQVTTRNSRVKARLFAEALRQLMEASDNVFIVGHTMPDMDCVGAALGIIRCAKTLNKPVYFVLDETNPAIENAIEVMRGNSLYRDCFRTPEQAWAMLRPSSVLMVVDTQRVTSMLAPSLLDKASKVVVIDHHRRAVDSIQNPTLNFLEAGSSSTCEMMTEVIQYFDDAIRPTTFECGALLAGITMDTKHFSSNTGARTFEAASYLRRNGADSATVKLMFQDDMQTYRDRAKVVEAAIIMEQGIAISVCPAGTDHCTLIAAQAADELISIKGIEAAFVLAEHGEIIYISGRSMGGISVQLILEKLGGGGHQSIAGAQLHGVNMDQAINRLTDSINTYLKEAKE